jgi:hypothetical protein
VGSGAYSPTLLTDSLPMLLPRFTLRAILAVTTVAAVFFLLVGTGYRGQQWAWGVAIGVLSLVVVAFVHAAYFGIVWCFARVAARRPSGPNHAAGAPAPLEATP